MGSGAIYGVTSSSNTISFPRPRKVTKITTVEKEYDEDGRLVREVVTETTEEGEEHVFLQPYVVPQPYPVYTPPTWTPDPGYPQITYTS